MAYKNLNGNKLEVTTYIKNPATGSVSFYKEALKTTIANADQTLKIINGGMVDSQPVGTDEILQSKLIINIRYTVSYDTNNKQVIEKEYQLSFPHS